LKGLCEPCNRAGGISDKIQDIQFKRKRAIW
jgi:hypothetical protein